MKGPYCIEVETDPVPQPRPRATVVCGKARVYNPLTTKAYKQEIIRMFVRVPDHFPEGVPVRVTIEYFFQRPKTLQRKKDTAGLILHTRKPDLDNLNKAVLDALSDSGIWNDDRQVCELRSRKFYTQKGADALVRITIEELQTC